MLRRFKILAGIYSVATVMVVGMGIIGNPVRAEDSTGGETHGSALDVTGGSATQDATIQCSRESSFSVDIPSTITLTGTGTPSQEFYVVTYGDIEGNKQVRISADETISMSTDGKDPVLCDCGFNDVWSWEEVAQSNVGKHGWVSTHEGNSFTAGTWTGTMQFSISLEDANP